MVFDPDPRPASPSDTLFHILTRGLAGRRDQPFLVLPDGRALTFGTLLDHAARAASWLARHGLRPGDRVLAQIDKSPAGVALYLGCLRAGIVFVPVNTTYTGAEVAYFLRDAEPRLVAASPEAPAARAAFDGPTAVLGADLAAAPWADEPPASGVAAVAPGDPAAILYTSGTTGQSKGAVLTHRNLSSNALVLHEAWRWREGDVLLHALPIYHAHGLFVALHGALLNGSTVLFHDRFDAAAVLRDLPRATVLMGVPTHYTRLLDEPGLTRALCAGMRLFLSGSGPLLEAAFAAFEARTGHRILERYGMTEAVMVTSNPYDGPRRAGTVGRPLPGVEVRLVAQDGAPAAPGTPGMLQLRGPNLFAGYWRNPGKTTAEHTADGYFVSGDLAVADPDGFLRIVGRSKDLIISGGLNVYPKEVELAIDALPGVAESAVIGVPHPDFGEGVVAVVVPAGGHPLEAGEIRGALAERLAPFKRPRAVIVADALPRNAMGKVQKAVLRSRHASLFAPASPRASLEPTP